MTALAYDIETWSNAFYICFYDGNTAATFTHRNLDALRRFVTKDLVLVGYNNFGFDDILLRHILSTPSATAGSINDICKRIIGSRQLPDDLWKISYSPTPWAYSIDMYQVLSKSGTLKELECRNHMVCVEESPVSFDAPLDFAYELQVQKYNLIDVQATWELYQKNIHLIELRQGLIDTYGLTPKVFCKPDAGITKELAMHQYRERTGGWSSTAKKAADQAEDNRKREWQTSDLVAKNIKFQTDEFRLFFKFFMSCKLIGDDRGTTWKYADDAFKNPVTLGGKEYQIGVGGLHSIDAPGRFESSKDLAITDFDVTSYYPSLILTLGLYPTHIGKSWLDNFRRIRDERIAAKHEMQACAKRITELEKELANLVE